MSWNVGEIRDVVAKRAQDLALPRCPCGCPETIFYAACHSTMAVRVAYDRSEKVLLLVCSVCNSLVAKIKVAE